MLLLAACAPPPAAAEPSESTCADPAARDEAKFDLVELPGEIVPPEPDGGGQYDGAGAAVGDFDGDGRMDLFLPNTGEDQLYLGVEGGFELSNGLIPDDDDDRSTGTVTADYDADGDLDLFVAAQGGGAQLWRNDGGSFSIAETGIGGDDYHGVGGVFGDYDADGDIDLFVINHYEGHELSDGMVAGEMPPGHPSLLYENLGDGTFADASHLLPEVNSYPLAAGFYDADGDGTNELYLVNDFGPYSTPNQLLKFDGSGFTDIATGTGLDLAIFGMGLGVGDLNDDAIPDFAMSSWEQLVLVVSGGDGWFDAGQALGFVPTGDQHVGWGVELADLDNDGDLDAPVAFGQLLMPEEIREQLEDELGLINPAEQPDALFIQDESGQFVDEAVEWGVADLGVMRGVLAVDLDGNGWLDLVKRDVTGPTRVYRARCGEEAWLEVVGMPVGSRVEVDGQRRWIDAGGRSFASGGPPVAHFGLGDAETVDVTVVGPDGEVATWEGVATRRRFSVER